MEKWVWHFLGFSHWPIIYVRTVSYSTFFENCLNDQCTCWVNTESKIIRLLSMHHSCAVVALSALQLEFSATFWQRLHCLLPCGGLRLPKTNIKIWTRRALRYLMILQRVLCQNVILKLKLVNYFSRSGGKLNEITDATFTKTDSRGKQIAWLKVLFERKVDFFSLISNPTLCCHYLTSWEWDWKKL